MTSKQRKMLMRIIVSAVLFAAGIILSLIMPNELPFGWAVKRCIFGTAYLIAGWDVIRNAVKGIIRGQVFDENFLMSIASIGAMIIGEYSEGAAVMIFFRVGELFESVAVGKSRRSIAEMMDISPETANVVRNGEISEVSPDEVQTGEIIVIRAGERIPLDGEVVFGSSGLNTAALTGESAPRDVTVGDEVISGCINTSGLIKVRVSRPYSDSTVARILELVENSSENKAKTESFITRFARVYTPIVVIAAALLAVAPPLVMMAVGSEPQWSDWIYRALTFLVVSCPCALVISVPLSYFGGIGGASRHGIMVKGANFLEALNKAQTFVFDKTGTLTKGSFAVNSIHPVGMTEMELLNYCGAAESFSTHPIGQSIAKQSTIGFHLRCDTVQRFPAENGEIPAVESYAVTNAEELAGYGVKADVSGRTVYAGSARLMEQCGVTADAPAKIGTAVHCAVDGKYAGYIIISDEIKEGAKNALQSLKKLCGARTIMLTGDRRNAGEAVASALDLDECHAELLPDGKVKKVEELYDQKPPQTSLVFVGDGMNDAPSLARADVGIAMGGLGSDAAIEAADIVLMNDNIEKLPVAVKIARKTHNIVMQNIIFAIAVKALVLILSAVGFANMWAAVFADVGVSVIAIINAMRAMNCE